MEQQDTRQRALRGKLDIGAILRLESGLHSGSLALRHRTVRAAGQRAFSSRTFA